MIVHAENASTTLHQGEMITMVADTTTVYRGKIAGLEESVLLPKEETFESPVRRRMNAVMAKISPLNLTDPEAPSFTPKHCKSIHDIIRYSHENVVKEMFGLSQQPGESIQSVKMTANIPLAVYFIDLGGGLHGSLTTCDDIAPDSIASPPMKALWRGLSHPGISWAGAVHVSAKNLMALMTSGPPPEMASYAVLSDEYVNLSFRFGYHYANLDILCTDEPETNYVSLQFGGGAGSYFGRSMRIRFLSEVLEQLGFTLNLSGDLLEAGVKGYDRASMEKILDQVGRLLASSRLLDLAIPSQDQVPPMVEAFLSGDYNFLEQTEQPLPDFYTLIGEWTPEERDGRKGCLQGGSSSEDGFSCTLKNIMGKMVGTRYQQFLDSIQAYHYFPLAVLKESYVSEASVQVAMKLEGGCIDRTGGLAFAIKNFGNYWVLSLDALENRVSLFEFVNSKRLTRQVVHKNLESERKYSIAVQIVGSTVTGYVDGERVIEYDGKKSLDGYVGLWAKADSKVYFEDLSIQSHNEKRVAEF
jgi:pyruvate,water dikinase